MFLNHYSCLSTVLTLFVLHSSHTASINHQLEHKLESEIRLLLERHNQYRKCHHVPPLVIDAQLTKDAQSLANALATEQINVDQALRWRHGNLFTTQWNLDELDDLFTLKENSEFSFNPVDKWYNEIKFYNNYDAKSRTDHFTRIVWKETKKLGVGIARNDKGIVYILCTYDPEGNIPGLYNKNVIIPDEKMIHATDICIFPPPTSPSKKKTNATSTRPQMSTVTRLEPVVTRLDQVSPASTSDFKVTSTYGQQHSSTSACDHSFGGAGTSTAPTLTQTDVFGSLSTGSAPLTFSPSMGSTQAGYPIFSDSSLVTSAPGISTSEPGYSTTGSATHLGSITWSRIMSSTSATIPGISTVGIPSFPPPIVSTTTQSDLLMPTIPCPALDPSPPADVTLPPFSHCDSSTLSPVDIFPTLPTLPESKPGEFISTSTIAPISTISTPGPLTTSTSISSEFQGRICNSSDLSGNLSCVLPPEDQPQGTDHDSQTPSSNRTTDWLDLPEHEYGNQTGDAFNPFGKSENKTEYLKFTLLFMGLLVASMSAAVSLLAIFALIKLFVCCRRARGGLTSQDASSSPAAQTPSNLVSIIPTTNPRPISPTLSRPASPVFQRTILSAKVY